MNSLPKTVTRQRRDCGLNPGRSAPESSTLPSHMTTVTGVNIDARAWHDCVGYIVPRCSIQAVGNNTRVCVCVSMFAGVWLGASERRIVAQIWRYFSPAHATSPSLSSAAADRWRTLLSVCNWRWCQHCAALIGRLLRRMRTQPLPPLYRESRVAWRLFSHSVLCFRLLLVFVVILSCLVELRSLLLYIGWTAVTESVVTILSPFCAYNLT